MILKMIALRRYRWFCVVLLAVSGWAFLIPPSSNAQQESAAKRRLVDRVAPVYPALARNMALEGVVKVEALVAPDGTVKGVDVKGGHPVLAQAAMNAVCGWKWEPASCESREVVELKFSPGE